MTQKKTAVEWLWQAAGKEKGKVPSANPYRKYGFDSSSPRLGWVKPPSWDAVEKSLRACLKVVDSNDEFIFIGMGGSINGIKTVLSIKKGKGIFTVDSLDPQELGEIFSCLKNLDHVMVIPISKSGTTKETQLLAHTLREAVGHNAREHFLWLVDKKARGKLDSLGWKGYARLPIQVNGKEDIGGRFTSPHTLVFLLPLFLSLNRDFDALKKIYDEYLMEYKNVMLQAYDDALAHKKAHAAYFSIYAESQIISGFRTWATQLFQESLGSKKKGFPAKTVVSSAKDTQEPFITISARINSADPVARLMCSMYYLENFVAFYAYEKKINFVNQPCVETYKKKMKALESGEGKPEASGDSKRLLREVKKKLRQEHRFIEIVLYFHPFDNFTRALAREFEKCFPDRKVFVFVGSDWNHHSYQAAYKDRETLYVLINKKSYLAVPAISPRCITENIKTLGTISYATYLTIKDHAILFALKA